LLIWARPSTTGRSSDSRASLTFLQVDLVMRVIVATSILSILLSGSAYAQQPSSSASEGGESLYSKTYSDCMDKSEGVTVNMLDCSADELRRQDTLLNESYQKLIASAAPQQREQLREAQRAWIKYRDTTCSLMQSFEGGGTLSAVIGSGCVLEETARRVKWLEDLSKP
jgi:uncharacterized protein YecT (DUF1311 family)